MNTEDKQKAMLADDLLAYITDKTLKSYALYTLLVVFLMVGCVEQTDQKVKTTKIQSGINQLSIVEIDGCEYIVYDSYKAGGLTHKGNCKNH
jgi:hypothetical protein